MSEVGIDMNRWTLGQILCHQWKSCGGTFENLADASLIIPHLNGLECIPNCCPQRTIGFRNTLQPVAYDKPFGLR